MNDITRKTIIHVRVKDMSKKAESHMRIEQKQGEKPIERKTKWEDEKPVVKLEKKEEPAKEKEKK